MPKVQKRRRNSEYVKYLLAQEAEEAQAELGRKAWRAHRSSAASTRSSEVSCPSASVAWAMGRLTRGMSHLALEEEVEETQQEEGPGGSHGRLSGGWSSHCQSQASTPLPSCTSPLANLLVQEASRCCLAAGSQSHRPSEASTCGRLTDEAVGSLVSKEEEEEEKADSEQQLPEEFQRHSEASSPCPASQHTTHPESGSTDCCRRSSEASCWSSKVSSPPTVLQNVLDELTLLSSEENCVEDLLDVSFFSDDASQMDDQLPVTSQRLAAFLFPDDGIKVGDPLAACSHVMWEEPPLPQWDSGDASSESTDSVCSANWEESTEVPVAESAWDYPFSRGEKQMRLILLLDKERMAAKEELRLLRTQSSSGCPALCPQGNCPSPHTHEVNCGSPESSCCTEGSGSKSDSTSKPGLRSADDFSKPPWHDSSGRRPPHPDLEAPCRVVDTLQPLQTSPASSRTGVVDAPAPVKVGSMDYPFSRTEKQLLLASLLTREREAAEEETRLLRERTPRSPAA